MTAPQERPAAGDGLHAHCDWPRCACWCGDGPGTWTHPKGGHHQRWGPNSADGKGNGYPPGGEA